MNAIKKPIPPAEPIYQKQVVPRRKRRLRQRSYQVMALEVSVKIGVNLAIAAAAASALGQLLPYHWSQQEKLREIRTELKLIQERVSSLQADFSRNFDPTQTKNIMQEQGYRLDPSQRRVVVKHNFYEMGSQ
ncbi:MAG: hypothetical protein QNJ47_09175 [Nostocaceae cyanobacterium]|nr:hypothetical protein [Nostocaceae cyanobacterium]